MLLGALNLTPIEVAQPSRPSPAVGTVRRFPRCGQLLPKMALCSTRAIRRRSARCLPAAYMTLWTMQQVVQRGTGRQLGAKYPGLHLAGKTGTTNNNVDTGSPASTVVR